MKKQRHLVLVASDTLAVQDLIAGVSEAKIKPSSRRRYSALQTLLGGPSSETRWLTSKVLRAKQTANRLFQNIDWKEDPYLNARNQGRWEGKTWSELRKTDPIACEAYWSMIEKTSAPEGEMLEDVRQRVLHFLIGIENQPDTQVVVVTHAVILRLVMLHILDAPLRHILRLEIKPLTVLHLSHDWYGWRINSLQPY